MLRELVVDTGLWLKQVCDCKALSPCALSKKSSCNWCEYRANPMSRIPRTLDLNIVPERAREAIRGFYSDYPPGVLVPHVFLPLDLQVPDVDERLAALTTTLHRAVNMTVLGEGCSGPSSVYQKLKTLLSMAPEAYTPFYFYIGGGFVVSNVLGVGHWTDIDIWTKPFFVRAAGPGLLVASDPRPPLVYPVSVMAVSRLEPFIESLDLHLCCCAILCCVLDNGVRGYELYMTKNCAIACKMRVFHACKLHPAMRLPNSVLEMINRHERADTMNRHRGHHQVQEETNFMLPFRSTRETGYTAVDLEAFLCLYQRYGVPCSTRSCHWNVLFLNGRICCISLCPGIGENMIAADLMITGVLPESKPVVVYPCRRPKDSPPFVPAGDGAHWLIRAITCKDIFSGVVACRGGSRVWSSLLVPEWLVDRQDLDDDEIEEAFFAAAGSDHLRRRTAFFRIPCVLPMQMLALMANWNPMTNWRSTLPVHAMWCYVLDATGQGELQTQMYCHGTHRLCLECSHASHATYSTDASGESL